MRDKQRMILGGRVGKDILEGWGEVSQPLI
jgi:hypothetical protein